MVYFARDQQTGRIKIGTSLRPRARLRQLQTGNGSRLELLGAVPGGPDREQELHQTFRPWRLAGEWFDGAIAGEVWRLLAQQGTLRCPGVAAVPEDAQQGP
jgi:hypothetical protein